MLLTLLFAACALRPVRAASPHGHRHHRVHSQEEAVLEPGFPCDRPEELEKKLEDPLYDKKRDVRDYRDPRLWYMRFGRTYPTLLVSLAGLPTAEAVEGVVLTAAAHGIWGVDMQRRSVELEGVKRAIETLRRNASNPSMFLQLKMDKPPVGIDPAQAGDLIQTAIAEDFAALGADVVDMVMLRDNPSCDVMQAQFRVLQEAFIKKRVNMIGTVNFCPSALECIKVDAAINPEVNYQMRHAGMGKTMENATFIAAAYGGVRPAYYGVLGEPVASSEMLGHPTVVTIATAHNRTVEEVAIRWAHQTYASLSMRPMADYNGQLDLANCVDNCTAGIAQMAQIYDWELTFDEMQQLDGMPTPSDVGLSPMYYSSSGCPGSYGEVDSAKTWTSVCNSTARGNVSWCAS